MPGKNVGGAALTLTESLTALTPIEKGAFVFSQTSKATQPGVRPTGTQIRHSFAADSLFFKFMLRKMLKLIRI
jgi:hypothetical protein